MRRCASRPTSLTSLRPSAFDVPFDPKAELRQGAGAGAGDDQRLHVPDDDREDGRPHVRRPEPRGARGHGRRARRPRRGRARARRRAAHGRGPAGPRRRARRRPARVLRLALVHAPEGVRPLDRGARSGRRRAARGSRRRSRCCAQACGRPADAAGRVRIGDSAMSEPGQEPLRPRPPSTTRPATRRCSPPASGCSSSGGATGSRSSRPPVGSCSSSAPAP